MTAAEIKTPKRGGRPVKVTAERRTRHIGFYVTEAEYAAIHARAAQAGAGSVSELGRRAILGAAIPAPRPSSYSPEVVTLLRRLGNNVNQCLKEARFDNFPPAVADAAEQALREVSAALRAMIHDPKA